MTQPDSTAKFDTSRAAEYETQSRIALAGYDACHELAACLLAASLDAGPKSVLIGGAGGTGQEILATARLRPQWSFTAADPSAAMLDQTMDRIAAAGLSAQVQAAPCAVQDLPAGTVFDAATLIGVLHHLPEDADKLALLQALSARLAPGAPFILACNRHPYDSQPLFLEAWAMRWRMAGADEAAVHAKLGKIRQGAVPPASEEVVEQMLAHAGFAGPPALFLQPVLVRLDRLQGLSPLRQPFHPFFTAFPMNFSARLQQLPAVTHLASLQLADAQGQVVATIENKPGQTGSLAVYHALAALYGGSITPAGAALGLEWYAEHTQDAVAFPGKHPNIDRLLAWSKGAESYRAHLVAA